MAASYPIAWFIKKKNNLKTFLMLLNRNKFKYLSI
jgi:hypothetical protein